MKKYSTTQLLTQEKPLLKLNQEGKMDTILFLPRNKDYRDEGGLRTQGYFKKSYDSKPLISVITVVFNGEQYIEQTIQSVIGQTYDNVEYIIIDGGSNDGTLDIIKRYESQTDYWVSEKDNGIYDAMNKGIGVASGKWINFMNAGDSFYNNKVLSEVFKNDLSGIKIVYGDRQVIFQNNTTKKVKAESLNLIWQGKPMCHQSCFVDAIYHKQNKFTLKYNICDDFEFIYDAYQKGVSFKYVNLVVANYLAGGFSGENTFRALMQSWMIVDKDLTMNIYYIWKMCQTTMQELIKYVAQYNTPADQRNRFQNSLSSIIDKLKEMR